MIKKYIMIFLIFIFNILFIIPTASAYVGPGMGGGIIASVLGIVFGIVTAIIGVLWFPFKRYLNKRKKSD